MTIDETASVRPRGPSRTLDEVDLKLVRALEADGRAAYEQLARHVGLSRPAVATRVQRLVDDRTIEIIGVVHPEVFGISHYAHLAVQVDGPVGPVADIVADSDDVVFVSLVAGGMALVAEVRASSQDAITEHVLRVRSAPGIRSVECTRYDSIIIDRDLVSTPHESARAEVDALDLEILRLLQINGRTTYSDIAVQVGLSAGAARTRVLELIKSGVVHINARVSPGPMADHQHLGFSLQLRDTGEAMSQLTQVGGIYFLATTLGRRDALGTVIVQDSDEALEVADRIRSIPGCVDLEFWWHMRYLKEAYHS